MTDDLPGTQAEFQLHCAVVDTLQRWSAPNWVFTHLPLPGWPDLILIGPKGHPIQRPHFLELKRRNGGFEFWCRLNDCPFAVADSYEAAIGILKNWGALRSGVQVQ